MLENLSYEERKRLKCKDIRENLGGFNGLEKYISLISDAWDRTKNMTDSQKLTWLTIQGRRGVDVFGYWFWDEEEYMKLISKEVGFFYDRYIKLTSEQQEIIKEYPYWG